MGTANFEPVPKAPTPREIEYAYGVIRDAIHVTPMLHSQTFSTMTELNLPQAVPFPTAAVRQVSRWL